MRRLDMFYCNTDELQKLVSENPKLPIMFLVDSEVVGDDYGCWWCADIKCYRGKLLDYDFNDMKIYTDESEFEEDLEEQVWENLCQQFDEPTDEQLKEQMKIELEHYNQYWKDVIIVHGKN